MKRDQLLKVWGSLKPKLQKLTYLNQHKALIKDALEATHDIYVSRTHTTHGDVFAIRKDAIVIPEETQKQNGKEFKIIKRPCLPDKILFL